MGRNDLFLFINDYYTVSPRFTGRGFEYITLLMRTAQHSYIDMATTGAIHNDYITVFLEFGFFGYFIWTGYWLVWHPLWTERFGHKAVLAQLLVSVYLFVTYLTDNTAFYFSTGIVARLMPMAFARENWSEAGKHEYPARRSALISPRRHGPPPERRAVSRHRQPLNLQGVKKWISRSK